MNADYLTDDEERRLRAVPRVVTPSKIDPWFGDWSAGYRWTRQQLVALADRGLVPDETPNLDVIVAVNSRDMWWPPREPAPLRRVPCPIVGRRLARVRVVSPRGSEQTVFADGYRMQPRARRARRNRET